MSCILIRHDGSVLLSWLAKHNLVGLVPSALVRFGWSAGLASAQERRPVCALVGRSTEVRLCSKADVNLATVNMARSGHPPNGVRPTGRRSVVQTSRLQEGQQVCVDRFRLRGRHAVWEVLVGLERPVFQKLRRQRPGIRVRNDLIVLTVHHQHRYGDFL
jgi:hypothetical protein